MPQDEQDPGNVPRLSEEFPSSFNPFGPASQDAVKVRWLNTVKIQPCMSDIVE